MKLVDEMNRNMEQEENALQDYENAVKLDKEALDALVNEKKQLMVKEKFAPPGVEGKIWKKIIDENGNEVWIEVDLQNEDLDNMSIYEEVIDEDGNVT